MNLVQIFKKRQDWCLSLWLDMVNEFLTHIGPWRLPRETFKYQVDVETNWSSSLQIPYTSVSYNVFSSLSGRKTDTITITSKVKGRESGESSSITNRVKKDYRVCSLKSTFSPVHVSVFSECYFFGLTHGGRTKDFPSLTERCLLPRSRRRVFVPVAVVVGREK